MSLALADRVLNKIAVKADPVRFVRERMGVDPDPWQEPILRDQSRNIHITCSRQIGKSFIVSLKGAHHGATTPDGLVLIFSPSEMQSMNLMRKAKLHIGKAGIKLKHDLKKEVEFENGARMVALPGSEKTVRSWSDVTMLIVDEAAFADDALYYAVEPMVLQSRGQIILLSSAYHTTGFFYEFATADDDRWSRYRVPVYESPRVPAEWIEWKRQSLPEHIFRREYLAEFIDPEGAAFTAEEIERAVDMDLEPFAAYDREDGVIDNNLEAFG